MGADLKISIICASVATKGFHNTRRKRAISAGMRFVLSTLPIVILMFLSATLEAQTFVITGAEGYQCGEYIGSKCQREYDSGTLNVVVNNKTASVYFGQGDTPASLAAELATAIHTAFPSVTATVTGSGSAISVSPSTVFLKDGGGNTDFNARATNVTTITLSTSSSSVTYGTSVTLTATVPSYATGTVTFKDGNNTLGTSTVSSGSATYSTSNFALGSHTITAGYSGDSNYSALTSSSITETVTVAAQTITVNTAAPSNAVYGGSFTVAATASSGLAVTFASSGGCSNNGATFYMTS
jgi:hypothetical protein